MIVRTRVCARKIVLRIDDEHVARVLRARRQLAHGEDYRVGDDETPSNQPN